MKNMKLISMTDFVLEELNYKQSKYYEYDSNDNDKSLLRIENYAKFLKQPLTLSMFFPCDENGNVLKEPKFHYQEYDLQFLKGVELSIAKEVNENVKNFEKAKEKVLFKESNLFIRNCGRHGISIETIKHEYIFNSIAKNTNCYVEDLIEYDLELTESAIKQI